MIRTVLPGVLTTVLALGLAGCGGDDPDPAGDGAGSSAADPASPTVDEAVFPVEDEVSTLAPALETAYRGGPYPQTVEEVEASLAEAEVALREGTTIGSYSYDADAVEFVLCLELEDGAWASYDTAPMGVRDSGATGGCPEE